MPKKPHGDHAQSCSLDALNHPSVHTRHAESPEVMLARVSAAAFLVRNATSDHERGKVFGDIMDVLRLLI